MGTPFKMKDFSGFGNSPMKQNKFNIPPKEFDWKASKKRAKEMVKKFGAKAHGTIEDVVKKSAKGAGKRALGFLGFMGGGSLSATATPKGTQTDLANFKFGRGEKIK